MDSILSTFIGSQSLDELFVLVRWPELEDLIEYEWFDQECFPCRPFDDQKHRWSAYFVPLTRLCEVAQPG